jgi:hypothetical protein
MRDDQADWEADDGVPHSARVWNCLLGGKDYYPPDRHAAGGLAVAHPPVGDAVRQLRGFTARAVCWLAAQGVRQFLDIGCGMPFTGPVHEVALAADPASRVAYADNDSLVLTYARALLTGPPGAVTYVDATLDEPAALLAAARDQGGLDFTRPVAILLISTLGHVGNPRARDDHAARDAVASLKDALPSGGYLAVGDLAARPGFKAALRAYSDTGAAPYRARTPTQLTRLLDGLELTGHGAGPARWWQPDPGPAADRPAPAWGAVGRKR